MRSLVPFVRRADWPPHDDLLAALRGELVDLGVVPFDRLSAEQRATARVAIVDGPDPSQLAAMPSLEFIQSTWAGVEELLAVVPDHIALARMIDPQLGRTMAEAVLAWTLYLHRDMPIYARQQAGHVWAPRPVVSAERRRVSILGLGVLGRLSAEVLVDQGFDVAGWSRSAKAADSVATFDGDDGLREMLGRTDILINLLPRTPETDGLLDDEVIGHLPMGASFINFGRGQTVVDDALLLALDARRIEHAVLDVFTVEPLPDDHPYWDHPCVTVLPHISGPTTPDTAAVVAARNVRRFLADGSLPADALVDRARGY